MEGKGFQSLVSTSKYWAWDDLGNMATRTYDGQRDGQKLIKQQCACVP